jgi:hypothetical protein
MKRVIFVCLVMAIAAGLAIPVFAQQQATPPLVRLLQSRGVITADEAAALGKASSAEEANELLARLLVQKGVISPEDYSNAVATEAPASDISNSGGHFVNAFIHIPTKTADPTPASSDPFTYGAPSEGGVIPAVAPVRVLPIDTPKQGGMIPDIKLGSGANMKLYGFFKASAIEQTASSGGAQNGGGQDFPLPLLLGDTGPNSNPYFNIKDRSTRFGSQFEWVPKNSDLVITGRLEMDFEGDYTTVNNRSISSARSSQISLRLAYVRLDSHWGEMPVFAEFGQDWTLLGSSTMPALLETTQLGAFFGNIYERAPQFKVGAQIIHSGDFKVQPEFAIVLPISSDANLTELQRQGFGDRAGADSNEPGVEGRVVFEFPLSHSWQGVPPAEIIFSGHHATMNEIVTHGASTATPALSLTELGGSSGLSTTIVPGATNCPLAMTVGCSLATIFPTGVQVAYPQNIWTAEVQLPTPFVTVDGKYYHGDDMRFFFGGQLNTAFATPGAGLVEAGSATSFSGQTILFGCPSGAAMEETCNGPVTTGALNPIRAQGGWVETSFPLSRIFHADPEGRNAGWTLHAYYGTDRAKAEDVRHGNGLTRTDYESGNLSYKINRWVSFVNEVTYFETQAATDDSKTFRSVPATKAHAVREEFGTVVTF